MVCDGHLDIFLFIKSMQRLFMLLQFYSLDKTDTPPKYILFPNIRLQGYVLKPFLALITNYDFKTLRASCMYVIFELAHKLYRICTLTFLETYDHFSLCLSLQPVQFGIPRAQRKSDDILTRVSNQVNSVCVCVCLCVSLFIFNLTVFNLMPLPSTGHCLCFIDLKNLT